jgi:hypothetical protein
VLQFDPAALAMFSPECELHARDSFPLYDAHKRRIRGEPDWDADIPPDVREREREREQRMDANDREDALQELDAFLLENMKFGSGDDEGGCGEEDGEEDGEDGEDGRWSMMRGSHRVVGSSSSAQERADLNAAIALSLRESQQHSSVGASSFALAGTSEEEQVAMAIAASNEDVKRQRLG